MPRPTGKKQKRKKDGEKGRKGDSTGPLDKSSRAGLPSTDSIISEEAFTSPKGKRYRIIKTTETDSYDKPAQPKDERKLKGGADD